MTAREAMEKGKEDTMTVRHAAGHKQGAWRRLASGLARMAREVKGDKGMENLYAFICPNCEKQLAATKEEANEGKRTD